MKNKSPESVAANELLFAVESVLEMQGCNLSGAAYHLLSVRAEALRQALGIKLEKKD
jgi:hypothetical protein